MAREIIIKQNQLKRIISEIGEVMTNTDIRGYSFDWDDNIIHMPTKIKMEKKEGNDWIGVNVNTEEFANLRNDPNYRLTPFSFTDFKDPHIFIRDTKLALENNRLAPSFNKFKESLINASPFSIITARGASPNTLKEAVKVLVGMTFNVEEMDSMMENIINKYPSTENMSMEDRLDFYLEQNDYFPVTSPEFEERFGYESDASGPEIGKKIALKDYVNRVVVGAKQLQDGEYKNLSIGFSDDDRKNIDEILNYIKSELTMEYPGVEFFVYDTSDGGKNKIIVSKRN